MLNLNQWMVGFDTDMENTDYLTSIGEAVALAWTRRQWGMGGALGPHMLPVPRGSSFGGLLCPLLPCHSKGRNRCGQQKGSAVPRAGVPAGEAAAPRLTASWDLHCWSKGRRPLTQQHLTSVPRWINIIIKWILNEINIHWYLPFTFTREWLRGHWLLGSHRALAGRASLPLRTESCSSPGAPGVGSCHDSCMALPALPPLFSPGWGGQEDTAGYRAAPGSGQATCPPSPHGNYGAFHTRAHLPRQQVLLHLPARRPHTPSQTVKLSLEGSSHHRTGQTRLPTTPQAFPQGRLEPGELFSGCLRCQFSGCQPLSDVGEKGKMGSAVSGDGPHCFIYPVV